MANRTLTVPSPLALIPYAERFLEGRRLVIFGDATAGLADEALDRGARLAHVYDPDPARVAQAQATAARGVSYAVHREGGDAGVRDGAFEVCLIPDLSMFADPRGLLAQVRRLVAAGSVVIAATPRVDGRKGESLKGRGPLNYYDFYDVLVRQFPAVKMVGQVPFHGVALVDFSLEGPPEVSVDASLSDDREPVAYVALASERRLSIDPYAIIQLPAEEADEEAPTAVDEAALRPLQEEARRFQEEARRAQEARQQAEAKLAEEQRRGADLARTLADAGALPRQLELKLTEEARRVEMLSAQIARGQETTERLNREVRTLQDRAVQAAKTLAEAQAERSRLAQREEAAARKIRELEAVPRGVDPTKVDALRQRVDEVEREKAAALHQLGELTAQLAQLTAQNDRLTAQGGQLSAQGEKLSAQGEKLSAQNGELTAQLAQLTAQSNKLAAQSNRLAAQNSELTAQLTQLSAQSKEGAAQHRELTAQNSKLVAQNNQLSAQITSLKEQLGQAHQQATELKRQVDIARAQAAEEQPEHAADLAAAELTLRERAREIAALRHEVERRGGMVRELLQALEAQESAPLGPTPALERERLVHLERELSTAREQSTRASSLLLRREADLAAALGRVGELEREKAASVAAEKAASVASAELNAALSEIQALRLALQQERAQRAQIEASAGASAREEEVALEDQIDHSEGEPALLDWPVDRPRSTLSLPPLRPSYHAYKARLLRSPRGPKECVQRRDAQGIPAAGAEVSPRP